MGVVPVAYGLDAFYCQPGGQGAHGKGGVEGQIGWFRRDHMVPVPKVRSLAELNTMIDQWDLADETRRIGGRARTVGELFAWPAGQAGAEHDHAGGLTRGHGPRAD